jgi:hypothetical protein
MTTKTKPHSKRTTKIILTLLVISAALFAIDYMEDGVVFAAPTVGSELIETGLNMNLVIFLALAFFFGFLFLIVLIKWR